MTSQAPINQQSLKDPAAEDLHYMRRVLALARKSGRKMSPNPRVAALLVKDRDVLGVGLHTQAGGPHAEVVALEQAGDAAKGGTLYVNLEPCNHFGHTPPCTQAIVQAGVTRVVVGCSDPNPKVCGGGNQFLESSGVTVLSGVLESESRLLNKAWLHWIQTGKPLVSEFELADGSIFSSSRFWRELKRDIDIVVLDAHLAEDFERYNQHGVPFVVGETPNVLVEKGIFFELIQSVLWIKPPKI